ncbi:MAG: right-handed parallel beta-helix repeat-containing protein, partial [Myxococcota bacterium]
MSRPLWCGVAATILLVGCPDSSGPPTPDASADAAPPGAADIPPPAPPMPPALGPCPSGWLDTEVGELRRCEPLFGRTACGPGTAWFAGGEACEPVGASCPAAGGFADVEPGPGRRIHVRLGATGDGTASSPYGSVRAALDSAVAGDTILLAAGVYRDVMVIDKAIRVVGACVTGTRFSGPVALSPGRILVEAEGVEVRNLTVNGDGVGLWVRPQGSAHFEDVVVDRAEIGGLTVEGAATGKNLVVQGTRPTEDGRFGRGIHLESGSTFVLDRAVIQGNREVGLLAFRAQAELTDVVIEDTREDASGVGAGLLAGFGSGVDMRRSVIQGNRGFGVSIDEAGTVFRGEDIVIRQTEATEAGIGGNGLGARRGAEITLVRGWVAENTLGGVSAIEGSRITIEDSIVEGTRPGAASG